MTVNITELLDAERTPDGLACTVLAHDGQTCSLLLPLAVVAALADVARAPAGSPVGEFPAIELLAVQAVVSPTAGRGLLLETRQLGPLALGLDDRRIAALRYHLASLAEMGGRSGRERHGK